MPVAPDLLLHLHQPRAEAVKDTFNINLLDQIDLTKVVTKVGRERTTGGGAARPPPWPSPRAGRERGHDRVHLRRLFWTVPVILLVILLTFMMMRQIGGQSVP